MSDGALAYTLEFGVRRHVRVALARFKAMAVLAFSYLTGKPDTGEPKTSVYGVKLISNWRDRTFRYCLYGTYGRHLSDWLNAFERPFVFLDVGANQGLFTLVAGRNPHCRRVVALEPLPRTFALLEANLRVNGVEDRVTAVNAALSDRSGTAEIRTKPNHSGAASLSQHRLSRDEASETIVLLDGAALAKHLPPDGEIVVKIDVEGHEAVVIEQLMGAPFVERISAVFYENDERWADVARARALLEGAGFTRFRKFGMGKHYDLLAER